MMNKHDRDEAMRRFVPWDHAGPLPSDAELTAKLDAARETDALEATRDTALLRAEADVADVGKLLKRLIDIEARLAALENAGTRK